MNLQEASLDIWDKKYRLKDKNGNDIDETIGDTFQRVAKALASVEEIPDYWEKQFLYALNSGAIPAGRILSNAGAEKYKPATSTINCTVSGTIPDSMDGILTRLKEAGLTLKAGCGIGYEFSTLRPKGAYVSGAGATTSGALSFMDIYDKMCFTIASAGGRRGAQMATFDISHPDVLDLIKAKREDGKFRQFNISLLITNGFIKAVENNEDWDLVFEGEVYRTIPAKKLWDLIMSSTYDYAEPGFILIDEVNRMNNLWFCEDIRATNPCGEQPLPPYGACLLGSIDLTKFVVLPFTDQARFDFKKYQEVISIFTRMLDNVVEIANLPLQEQMREIKRKRRHGMGYFGLGSTLTMLGMEYGSEDSIKFTKDVTATLAETGWKTGIKLAKEKGSAPIMEEDFEVTEEILAKEPRLAEIGYKLGDSIKGKILFTYSKYMQRLEALSPGIIEDIYHNGCRFTHHSSIAPTGTISLSVGNNASNGIEPSFAHEYFRNVIREGKKTKEQIPVYSYEWLKYKQLFPKEKTIPRFFKTTDDISPEAHIAIQSAAQYYFDSFISKTINVPTNIAYEEFKEIYLKAYRNGLKGCTTFRFNPEAFQGVLVKEADLENTTYQFTLEDGTVLKLKGNDEVEYDGEVHTTANLFDALKEGYYGKF